MFRFTTTFLVIFLMLNHEFAAARSSEFSAPQKVEEDKSNRITKYVEAQSDEIVELEAVSKTSAVNSRHKRSAWGLLKLALAGAAAGSTALSVGSQVYHAIRKCRDYRPKNCKVAKCNFIPAEKCPDVCRGPETNRKYVQKERDVIKKKLDAMDATQQDAFNLATKAISASLNNQAILNSIDNINNKVNELVDSIAKLDFGLATRLRNSSVRIGTLLRNERLSLEDIVARPEVDGIFDKWTWDGTFPFVLLVALPLSSKVFSYFKRRFAVRKIYKNLKLDLVNKRLSLSSANPKVANQIYRNGAISKNVKVQLKQQAKIDLKTARQQKTVSTKEKYARRSLSVLVKLAVIALSVWTTYTQINNCQMIANDIMNTAYNMSVQSDRIEEIKVTQVEPLIKNVTTQAWPRVRKMMTNATTQEWLEGIRNLTLGSSNPNYAAADTIQDFVDNIGAANYDYFLKLQNNLKHALKGVYYKYSCLAKKQNAITTVITDCRIGRQSFPELYAYATNKHTLNVQDCIAKGEIPYTTQAQFFTILNATAHHQGWYTNCLLNSNALLYRVCSEKLKGYTTPQAILAELANTTWGSGLTKEMIPNFLSRCPPPKITPKSITTTCDLYCLYQPVAKIAKTAQLLDSQVIKIMRTCPICEVKTRDLKTICHQHYCKGKNASTVEKEVEIPLATVNFIIAHNCSKKCIIEDIAITRSICQEYKCQKVSVAQIARYKGLTEQAVKDIVLNCNTILPVCVIPRGTKLLVLDNYCKRHRKLETIAFFLDLSLADVQKIIASVKSCEEYIKNGLPH